MSKVCSIITCTTAGICIHPATHKGNKYYGCRLHCHLLDSPKKLIKELKEIGK